MTIYKLALIQFNAQHRSGTITNVKYKAADAIYFISRKIPSEKIWQEQNKEQNSGLLLRHKISEAYSNY